MTWTELVEQIFKLVVYPVLSITGIYLTYLISVKINDVEMLTSSVNRYIASFDGVVEEQNVVIVTRRLYDVTSSITNGRLVSNTTVQVENGSDAEVVFSVNDNYTLTEILVNGEKVGVNSKKVIAYLPERSYLDRSKTIKDIFDFFEDFYDNFDRKKAQKLLAELGLDVNQKLSKMSKGMKEKVQLVLVMSRKAKIYILDEPLGGVDPASRDYILKTILKNFDENATLLISTHMIADIESILDEVIFIDGGKIVRQSNADELRKKEKCSIDEMFRREFYVK